MTTETFDKIKKFSKFGSILGLERIEKLTDLLGNPQEGLKYIHVGGTNGKGSVSKYIYSVLMTNGYEVGMFTSPFMEGFREAIVVNDSCMTEDELDSYYAKIEAAVTKMTEEGFESPTEFEIITALGLLYFRDKSPDFVIMEVGLGGIGDSTNIIGPPLFSVITSVSLDHCDVLGETIEEIAREKAGIIKESIPVISNVRNTNAAKVIAREAYRKNAPLINAVKFKTAVLKQDTTGSIFSVNIDGINYPEMEISMPGAHQVDNAVCALTVIEQLRKKALIGLDREKTIAGLKTARLDGRFEIIDSLIQEKKNKNDDLDTPIIIMDGAHNEEGAKALASAMNDFYKDKKVLTIFALMKDKEPANIVNEFLRFSDEIIVADILADRPIDAKGLINHISGSLAGNEGGSITENELSVIENIPGRIVSDKSELMDIVMSSNDFDIILITGSLYLIRDLRPDIV